MSKDNLHHSGYILNYGPYFFLFKEMDWDEIRKQIKKLEYKDLFTGEKIIEPSPNMFKEQGGEFLRLISMLDDKRKPTGLNILASWKSRGLGPFPEEWKEAEKNKRGKNE
jgi:hypothetical protein